MYNFSSGTQTRQFVQALSDAFPLFRMFLDDCDDAAIVMFLHTQQADEVTLLMLRRVLAYTTERITERYPTSTPSPTASGPAAAQEYAYGCQSSLQRAVFHLLLVLTHLQGNVASFSQVVHFGGNPTSLE